MNKSPKKQRGIALIIVMLVVALVVIIAANMTGRLQLLMSRSINQQLVQQGIWSALAGEQLVYKVLEQDFKDNNNSVHLAQLWARDGMMFPVGDGMLEGEVQDLHSCFNLNVLATKEANSNAQNTRSLASRQFEALLRAIEIEDYVAEQLTSTITDWVDSDTLMTGSLGAEDETYSSKVVPYLTPNSPMVNLTELMAVEGMTSELYRTIRPYVCVLPGDKLKLNVNTIKPEHGALLVAAFEDRLGISDAKSVLGARGEEGYNDISEFLSSSEITAIGTLDQATKDQFQIISKEFRARLTFSANEQKLSVESVFRRDKNNKLAVVLRQFGLSE